MTRAISLFLLLISITLCKPAFADYQITHTGHWVKPIGLAPLDTETIPYEQLSDGVYYRLVDDQFKVNDKEKAEHYIRYVMLATNQTGVEDISQLNLSFDPTYERLELHHLQIIRDGQVIDKLPTARMQVIQREQEAEQLIYDGSKTLNIILDDVRPGDSLDYAYTKIGRNPIYQGLFGYTAQFDWSVPVGEQNVRMLWDKQAPLHISQLNGELEVSTVQTAQGMEYTINARNPATKTYDSQTPKWYDPYHLVFLSEFDSWQQVVQWAQPLYENALSNSASIADIATQIRAEHGDIESQIGAALKYTQDEIRYLGLEMGSNSHMPTPADETLRLRYGDCKDKTVVLMSILDALGVESHPALVNTEVTKGLINLAPASNRFDHVLVTLEHQGERYWLDPTNSYQTGSLKHLSEPDFGYALIVKQGETALRAMFKEEPQIHRSIIERYTIPSAGETTATFSVHSHLADSDAIDKRRELASKGLQKVQENYTNYYQDYFAGTQHSQLLTVEEDPEKGEIIVKESYVINDFWTPNGDDLNAYFYADDIRDALYKPDVTSRISPLSLRHPFNVDYIIEVQVNELDWGFDNDSFELSNDFFDFSSSVHFEDKLLTLSYHYRSKTDHIPTERIGEYLQAQETVKRETSYGIRQDNSAAVAAPDTVTDNEEDTLALAIGIYVLAALGALTMFFTLWRIEAGQRPHFEAQRYFPVSVVKFYIYSVLSWGIYPFYWSYRNWRYIKEANDESIMPIARGIFGVIWFYPLFHRFAQESEKLGTRAHLPATWFALLLAAAVIAVQVAGELTDHLLIITLLLPLPWLPLVNYTAYLNRNNEALHYHSKWRVHQAVVCAAFAPLFLYVSSMELGLSANYAVIAGDKIWQHDKRFMVRKGLLNQNEQIIYFYSDAIWNIREDGNGITNNGVFSYYRDEGALIAERADYADIGDIKATFDNSDSGYTVVDVERTDGSSFRLILSGEEEGDHTFVQEMKRRWRESM
ncbi:DUF3857 domain-containing transglutaminase family protein [Pseudoalteromonas sp. SSDWG2]|uniref:DUF3857 domain-containing transglutaminase family protein n=1 Tax=Pseudoalteromonas sp. SSDWG2 TaxID=3139391 RepID=UPI003BAA81AD